LLGHRKGRERSAGRYPVDPYLGRQLVGELTDEAEHSVLACGVERSTTPCCERGVRDSEDQRAAASGQLTCACMCSEQVTDNVDVEQLECRGPKQIRLELGDRNEAIKHRRVADEDVQPAERVDREAHGFSIRTRVTDVSFDRQESGVQLLR